MIDIFLTCKETFEKDCSSILGLMSENSLFLLKNALDKKLEKEKHLFLDNLQIKIKPISEGVNTHCIVLFRNTSNPQDEKLKFLGEISTNLFHELRSPLNILISSMELLKMELFESDESELKTKVEERANDFESGVLKIYNIINGLQKFAQGKVEFKSHSVIKFVKDNIKFTEMFLKQDKISISIKNELTNDVKVSMQDNLLAQVLINLIKNSADVIKSFPEFNRWISVIIRDAGSNIEIEVIDGGDGISEENQKKLFTYGFTTKGIGTGFGIGLNFCKKVVATHKGEIFYNKFSKNTSFIIRIPKERENKIAA
jgi:two-component system NtrC family sensor kinase